jgi:hypothetical protein
METTKSAESNPLHLLCQHTTGSILLSVHVLRLSQMHSKKRAWTGRNSGSASTTAREIEKGTGLWKRKGRERCCAAARAYERGGFFLFSKWSIAPASASSDAHSLFY